MIRLTEFLSNGETPFFNTYIYENINKSIRHPLKCVIGHLEF